MAQNKTKTGRISEYLILVFVIVGVLLVLVEIGTNVMNEINATAGQF